MANELKTYTRKISDEETQGVYIMILKNALDFFPKVGKPFKLKVKGESEEKTYDVTIGTVERWSIGPKKPQRIYQIDTKPFRDLYPLHFGKKIVITKNSDDEYTLS